MMKNKGFAMSVMVSQPLRLIAQHAEQNQNQLTLGNLQKIIDTYKARETTGKYSYLASLEEIAENDFNLNIPRYVDTFEEEAEIDLVAVRTERIELQNELKTLEAEMEGYLKELDYAG